MGKTPFFARRRGGALVEQAHRAYDHNDTQGAWQTLERAIKEDPRNGQAEFLLGRIANDQGQHAIAVEHLTRATTLTPSSADAFGELGRALHESRRRPEAEEAYKRALSLRDDPYIAINFATLLRDSGRFAEATELYRRALAARGLDAETRARIEGMV